MKIGGARREKGEWDGRHVVEKKRGPKAGQAAHGWMTCRGNRYKAWHGPRIAKALRFFLFGTAQILKNANPYFCPCPLTQVDRFMDSPPVLETDLSPHLEFVARGKVRELWEIDASRLLFVATDRISGIAFELSC